MVVLVISLSNIIYRTKTQHGGFIMTTKLCSIQATPETRVKLRKLAKADKRSMCRYLEVKIDKEYQKIFTQD